MIVSTNFCCHISAIKKDDVSLLNAYTSFIITSLWYHYTLFYKYFAIFVKFGNEMVNQFSAQNFMLMHQ